MIISYQPHLKTPIIIHNNSTQFLNSIQQIPQSGDVPTSAFVIFCIMCFIFFVAFLIAIWLILKEDK